MADDPTFVDEYIAEATVLRQHLANLQRDIGPGEMCSIVRQSGSVTETEIPALAAALRSAGYVNVALLSDATAGDLKTELADEGMVLKAPVV